MSTITVDAERYAKLEEMERKAKLSARRATVKNLIFVEKAKAAGILVSKSEIDKKIAAEDALKASDKSSVPSDGTADPEQAAA